MNPYEFGFVGMHKNVIFMRFRNMMNKNVIFSWLRCLNSSKWFSVTSCMYWSVCDVCNENIMNSIVCDISIYIEHICGWGIGGVLMVCYVLYSFVGGGYEWYTCVYVLYSFMEGGVRIVFIEIVGILYYSRKFLVCSRDSLYLINFIIISD